jgi:hypothetical protein
MEKVKINGTQVSKSNSSGSATIAHEQLNTSHGGDNGITNTRSAGTATSKSNEDSTVYRDSFRYAYSGRKLL